MMRKDKLKVLEEVWDDARVGEFLDKAPLGDENLSYSRLLYAYRSMRAEDFARFVPRFIASGGDINATNLAGQTLLEVIEAHTKSAPFRKILSAFDAAG